MKPDIATAITNALIQGGSLWLIATIVAFLPVLWTMTLMLHLGRPYVLRTLRRCGLRLGADIWWMSYLLMRDAIGSTQVQHQCHRPEHWQESHDGGNQPQRASLDQGIGDRGCDIGFHRITPSLLLRRLFLHFGSATGSQGVASSD